MVERRIYSWEDGWLEKALEARIQRLLPPPGLSLEVFRGFRGRSLCQGSPWRPLVAFGQSLHESPPHDFGLGRRASKIFRAIPFETSFRP